MLSKLEKLGIRGTELKWFSDYLTNRKQLVCINSAKSTLLDILIGVPQGSILGPLLFLIYINDLPLCSRLIALLFADDTTLYMSDSNLECLINNVNLEFKKVVDYFRFLKLALHPSKTKYILFTNSAEARATQFEIKLNFNNDNDLQNPELVTNLSRVPSDSSVKFLGIEIDPLLSFKTHINTINSKISKSMYFLRAVKNFLPLRALRSIYFAIIHSHLIYGIQIWSCCSQSNLNSLILKQKLAIRITNNAKYNAHTEPLFKNSNILPLNLLIQFFNLKFFHAFINNLLPLSFANIWQKNDERRQVGQAILRNQDEYYVPPSRLMSTERFPLFNLPKLWNNIPINELKTIVNKNTFNFNLKKSLMDQLSVTVHCNRLLCPCCHLVT